MELNYQTLILFMKQHIYDSSYTKQKYSWEKNK